MDLAQIAVIIMVIYLNKAILKLDTEEMMVMNLNGHIIHMGQKPNAVIMKEDPLQNKAVLNFMGQVLMDKLINN